MITLALGLGLLSGVQAQEAPGGETVQAVLEQLIERARSQGAFRVRYRFEGFSAGGSLVEVAYLPEERMHMRASSEEEAGSFHIWMDGPRFVSAILPAEGPGRWSDVDLSALPVDSPAWLELLEERFPLVGEASVVHAELDLQWALNEDTDKVAVELSTGFQVGPGFSRLGWLLALGRDPSLLHMTDEAIVQDHPRFHATVSRRTGFLEELIVYSASGEPATVRLESLELDPDLEPADLRPPKRPEGVEDVSRDWSRTLLQTRYPLGPRRTVLQRIVEQLSRGTIEWTTQTRDGCEELFGALHRPVLEPAAESYRGKTQETIRTFFEELRERRSQGEPGPSLDEAIDGMRAELVETLERGLPALQSKLAPAPALRSQAEAWDDLLEFEKSTLEALYAELFQDPLLASFEEAAGTFREGG